MVKHNKPSLFQIACVPLKVCRVAAGVEGQTSRGEDSIGVRETNVRFVHCPNSRHWQTVYFLVLNIPEVDGTSWKLRDD